MLSCLHSDINKSADPALEVPWLLPDGADESVFVTTGGLHTFGTTGGFEMGDIPGPVSRILDTPSAITPMVSSLDDIQDMPTAITPAVSPASAPVHSQTSLPGISLALASLPLRLDAFTYRMLLEMFGPSLGLWRAAEIAALQEMVDLCERPILDVGCGDGIVTSLALPLVDVGLDPDERTLERAARLHVYEQFECVPIEEISRADESFNTVISNSVLEHLPRLDDALASMARVLRPGGRLIFTAPTEEFSTWLALPTARYANWRNRHLCHLNLWTVEEWTQHLERAGFVVEQVRPYLRHELVTFWDMLELLQQIWIGHRRLFSLFWRRLPPSALDMLAQQLARLDLSAKERGGGRLIVARKR